MSFQAMTWAVEQDLPALQKLVLLMLANRTNPDTGRCDPSHDKLSADCGMSKDSVKRAIAELADKGLLDIRRQAQNGVNLPNQYTLRVGSSVGVVGADSTYGVGADSTQGGCLQQGGVGADSTTKHEVKTEKKLSLLSDSKFDDAWKSYPKREGGNSKQAALKAWTARIREGVDPDVLVLATKAYAVAMQKAGNVGTRYVRQASTFFGPDRHFDEFATPGKTQDGLFQAAELADNWWTRAGFRNEWDAMNAGCTERNSVLWRDGRPIRRLAGANVEPWPETTA
ncbi:ArsR family transcriptional regulator [Paraburkholderia tropica]|uniref:ArsR family transcriptional regulator n=1 Tax=Paraburkholderia tropica TaxID=92647 RepID=A0ABX5MRQ9_9BURK|nr:helix-turn-helix domain-containing protein [Paraburkholderia tropica]PXX15871.1 ArsR family transcriptional regulator [Paraburkholderia tropica]PZW82130.1 ArsR family transcriptional regulator [Paraburkholderia tropica]